jgi:hypothetical protein
MAMAVMLPPMNAMLADPASTKYADAAAVVARATSCRDAVDQLGLLEGLAPEVVREAEAVFAALPTGVDQGILGALRAGFDQRSPMSLHWDRDVSEGEPTIAHRVDEQDELDNWVHIHVVAPDGTRFI